MLRYIAPVLLLFLVPGWNNAAAASSDARDYVALSVNSKELWLEPGKTASVVVSASIAKDWHIYGVGRVLKEESYNNGPSATEIRLLPSDVVALNGRIGIPKPKMKYDDNFEAELYYYKGQVDFTVPIRISRKAKPGAYTVAVEVYYMVCDTVRCYPPKADTVQFTVLVESDSESMQFRQNEPRRGSLDEVPAEKQYIPAVPGRAEQQYPEFPEQRTVYARVSLPVFTENKYFVSSSPV